MEDEYEIKLEKSDDKGMFNLKQIKDYLDKAENAICKINLSKGYGSGFFCKIPYTKNNNLLLPVLITNYHVLPKDVIESKNYIEIIINDEIKHLSLKERKKWTNEKIDFTVIEIIEKDDIDDFFYLDDNILKKNYSKEYYLKKHVIVYAINKNKEVGFSNGNIKKIKDFNFIYDCNTFPGCSGGCVVNQSNNCVIGIHRGEIKIGNSHKINNIGIFIWDVIDFIKNIGEEIKINITIADSKGSRKVFKVGVNEQINVLKKLTNKNAIFFFNGNVLADDDTFEEYDIMENDSIVMAGIFD